MEELQYIVIELTNCTSLRRFIRW